MFERPGLANVCDLMGKSLHSRLLSVMSSLRPNISMHILHTVLYTFLKTLTRRVCITIMSFFIWWSFPLFSWPSCLIQGWYCIFPHVGLFLCQTFGQGKLSFLRTKFIKQLNGVIFLHSHMLWINLFLSANCT